MAGLSNNEKAVRWYQETRKLHSTAHPDLAKVVAGYRKAVELDPNFADAHYALGVALLGKGELTNAFESLSRALQLKPDSAEAWFHLAQVRLRQQKPGEAEVALRKAIDLTPRERRGSLYFTIAVSLQSQNKLKEAEECYRLGLEVSPDDRAGNFQFALFLQNSNRNEEAAELLDRMIAERADRDVLNLRALVYARQQNFEEAVSVLEKALEQAPEDAGLIFNLAQMEDQRGNRTRAAELLNKTLEIQPRQPGALGRLAAIEAGENKDYEKALELLNKALGLAPEDPTLLYQKGAVLAEQGRKDEAVAMLESALQRRPRFPEAQAMLARLQNIEQAQPVQDPAELEEQLKQDPENDELQRRLAQSYLVNRRFEDAVRVLDELLVKHPDDTSLKLNRAFSASQHLSKDPQEVIRVRDELRAALEGLEAGQENDGARLRLAQINIMLREPEDALESLESLLSRRDNDPRLYSLYGVAMQQKARFEDARKAFERVVELIDPEGQVQPGDPRLQMGLMEAITALAQIADGTNDVETATRWYDRWHQLTPQDAAPLGRLANLYNRNKRFEEGLATVERIEVLMPEDARTKFLKGLVLADLKRPDEAEAALVKALELQPEFPEAQQRLEHMQQSRPLVAATAEELEESLQEDPDNNDDRLLLSHHYLRERNWDKAIEHLEALTSRDNQNHRALFDLSQAYVALGNLDRAIDCLIQLEERLPNDPNIRYGLAELLLQNGETELAVKEYRNAAEMMPRNPLFHFRLGQAMREQDRDDRAEEAIRKAIEIQDNFPAAHYELGLIEYTSDREEAALKSFGKAFTQNQRLFMALYYSGMIMQTTRKNPDEARKFFQSVLSLQPEHGDSHWQLGRYFHERGRKADARYHLEKALASWDEQAFNRPAAEEMLAGLGGE